MKVALDESLTEAVRRRVEATGHASPDEYVDGLIRARLIPRVSQLEVRETVDAPSRQEHRTRAPQSPADA